MDQWENLALLVAQQVASPYSDFYRTLYGVPAGSKPDIKNLKDWELLPNFRKDILLERSMREYTFVPHSDVEAIYYTSGTSGKPPFLCPRLAYAGSHTHRRLFYDFTQGTILSGVKAQHRQDIFMRDMQSPYFAVNVDIKHIAASIKLAKTAGVTVIYAHTFMLQTIGEEMKRVGMNKDIRLIDFIGETCSLALYSYLRDTFPNAAIISSYGLSEVEGMVGIPCRALSDNEPYPVFHPHPGFHIDLIDSETGETLEPKAFTEGEVLITDLARTRALPLIKYRPGDSVRVVDERCKQHGTWSFMVLGRTASDFMLIPGGQLRADEVERVLRSMSAVVSDQFVLHRYESDPSQKTMLKVVLAVELIDHTLSYEALAEKIAREMRVAPNRTYADGVAAGLYEPLVCTPFTKPDPTKKHRRMVKH